MHDDALRALKENKIDNAIRIYRTILKKTPNDYFANCNIAYCYLQKNNFSKSILFYRNASRIRSSGIEAINGLGSAYIVSGNQIDGIKCFHKVIKLNSQIILTLNNLANHYFIKKKYLLSLKYYFKIHKIDPKNIFFYAGIFKVYHEMGKYTETLLYLKKGLRLYAFNNLYLYFLYLNTYPKIHFSKFNKQRILKRFSIILKRLDNRKKKFNLKDNEIVEIFSSITNFYLAYSINVPLDDLRKYSDFISFFSKKIYQKNFSKNENENKNKKKKIIIISSFFFDHTVTRLYYKFFKNLHKDFELYYLSLSNQSDKFTRSLEENSIQFQSITKVNEAIDFLQKNFFDAIFYPEIGMCPKVQFLASLRLSPVQFCGWGHPISTGSSEIDYFISSDLMEPICKDIKNLNYSENLVKLSGLGIDFSLKIFPKYNLVADYSAKRSKLITIQSLFKILPEDLGVYFKILEHNNFVSFTFIKDQSDEITNKFISLIKSKFTDYFKNNFNLFNFEKKFIFINQMRRKEFIQNLKNYHIVLDTFNWSGGNTHLEALLSGVPVVTMPAEYMRSRHTYAFLKKINQLDLIAKNKNHYCEIVKKLLIDDNFYQSTIHGINKNNHLLYNSNSYDHLKIFLDKVLK